MISRGCDVLSHLTCGPLPTRNSPEHREYRANVPSNWRQIMVGSTAGISSRRASSTSRRARLLGASAVASRAGLGAVRSDARYATHLAVFENGDTDLHRRRLRCGRHVGVRQRVPGVAAFTDGKTSRSCRGDPHTRTRAEFEPVHCRRDCRLRGVAAMAPPRTVKLKRVKGGRCTPFSQINLD